VEWPVRDCASSVAFGRNIVPGEGDFFEFCVTEDGESNSPKCSKTVSHDVRATDFRPT